MPFLQTDCKDKSLNPITKGFYSKNNSKCGIKAESIKSNLNITAFVSIVV